MDYKEQLQVSMNLQKSLYSILDTQLKCNLLLLTYLITFPNFIFKALPMAKNCVVPGISSN